VRRLFPLLLAGSVLLGGEVFCGRNPDLPAADVLERAWSALVLEGNVEKARRLFESVDRVRNRGPSLFMGLETVYNFRNEFTRSLDVALEGLRASRRSPWAEVFLYDVCNLAHRAAERAVVRRALEAVCRDKGFSPFLRDYARFRLGKLALKEGRPAAARAIFDDLAFVRKGAFCGPFPNRDGAGFVHSYAPEKRVALAETYPGINRPVGWRRYETPRIDGYVDFSAVFYPYDNAVGYGLFSVFLPAGGEYLLHVGTENAVKVWVNYQEVFSSTDKNRLFFDRYVLRARFLRGWNVVMVKLGTTEADEEWGMYLRLTGKDGTPVRGLRTAFPERDRLGSGIVSGRKAGAEPIPSEAERFFRNVLRSDPENSMAYGTLGFVYSQRSRGDRSEKKALKLYEEAHRKAPACPLWTELAGAVDDDVNKTIQALEESVRRNPSAVSMKESVLLLLFSRSFFRRFEQRLDWIAAEPPERTPFVRYMQGVLYLRRGWEAEARLLLEEGIRYMPWYAEVYRARERAAEGEEDSVRWLERLLEVDHTDVYALEKLAGIAHRRQRTKKALRYYRDLVTYRPTYVKGYLLLASLYRDEGRTEKALRVLHDAERVFPDHPAVKRMKAEILLRQGKKEEAVRLLERALEADPNLVAVREHMDFLRPPEKRFYAEWDFDGREALSSYKGDARYKGFNTVDVRVVEVVEVHANGTEKRMVHALRKALTEFGAAELRRIRVPFAGGRSRVDVRLARVIKPDGQVVETNRIYTRAGVRTTEEGAALYRTYQVKVVEFPLVEAGDAVEYRYVVSDTSPDMFTDEFSDINFLVSLAPAEETWYVVKTPPGMKLHVGTFHTSVRPAVRKDPDTGGWIYAWHVSGWEGIVLERSMPPVTEYVPCVVVSTMESWKDVGKWYTFLTKDLFHLGEETKETVRRMTAGKKTALEKARAVFGYVRDNIRYVGIEFGRNSLKPHRAEETLRTRYGDCKDTAVLLAALLREAGIPAHVCLVRTRHLGEAPTSVASPYLFNHAVCLVPGLEGVDRWLDGTTDFFRMEEVPWNDRGGLVLVVDGPRSRIGRIPDTAAPAGSLVEAEVTVDEGGGARVTVTERFFGDRAPTARRYLHSPERFKRIIERVYARKFTGFTLDAFSCSKDPWEESPWYRVRGRTARYGLLKGKRLVLPASVSPLSLSEKLVEEKRTYPLWLRIRTFQEERLRIRVPPGFRVVFYPESVDRKVPDARFRRKVVVEGNLLRVSTRFEVTDTVVEPARYPEYKRFCAYVDGAYEERIVCRREGGGEKKDAR